MKNKFIGVFIVMLSALLSSCLDDGKATLDPSTTQNVIEFLDPSVPSSPAGAIYPAYANSLSLVPQATIEQIISYSGPTGNSKDIELTLAVDPIALQDYNKQMTDGLYGKSPLNGSTYELLPAANYSIESTKIVIPSGETKVTLAITVFPDKFDFSKNYALPIRIVSSSSGVISAHFSVAILSIGVRNSYDGVYEIVGGSITRNTVDGPDLALGGTYGAGLNQSLVTLSLNTLSIEPLWKDGSGVGGITGTSLTIDLTTNKVIVKSSGNATLKNTPATVNEYNPTTKEFTLNFDWGSGATTRIVSGLKLKYVKARP